MLKAVNKQFNIKRFTKERTNRELIVENIIFYILRARGGTEWIESYIPIKLIQRYAQKDGIELTERQIRYNIDKLIAKRRIKRRTTYSTIKGKVIKKGNYKMYWNRSLEYKKAKLSSEK